MALTVILLTAPAARYPELEESASQFPPLVVDTVAVQLRPCPPVFWIAMACGTGLVTGSPVKVKAAFEITRLSEAGFTPIVTVSVRAGFLLSCCVKLICQVYDFGARLLCTTV